MAIKRGDVDALADPDRAEKVSNIQKKKRASTRMQANFRGKHDRESLRRGEVPQRTPAEQAAVKARAEKRRAAELADAAARGVAPPPPEPADDEAYDDESVDSDYDVDDGAFANLGRELLSGPLKIAKVYGQDEPPAQEDELEWEVRYCILTRRRRLLPLRRAAGRLARRRPRDGAPLDAAHRREGRRRRHLRDQGGVEGVHAQARPARRRADAHVDLGALAAAPLSARGFRAFGWAGGG